MILDQKRLARRLKKKCREQITTDRLAAILVRTNPDFPVETLIREGYIKEFPYKPEVLWRIKELWYTVPERDIEKKFKQLLKEVEHEFQ